MNVAENMGVAAHHLFADAVGHFVKGEHFALFSQLGMEYHLQEEVAQFFFEVFVVRSVDGVDNFVTFFNEIFAEREVILFFIPGTAVFAPELFHDRQKTDHGVAAHLFFFVGHFEITLLSWDMISP